MRKKQLLFTFEVDDGEAAIEVIDPATGVRVCREESYSLYSALKSIGDPKSLSFEEILYAGVGEYR